jgi:hypothetical protein
LTFEGNDEFTKVLAKNILYEGSQGVDINVPGEGGELKLVFSRDTSNTPVVLP